MTSFRTLLVTVIFVIQHSRAQTLCDQTCFGVPFGAVGCSIANEVSRTRYACNNWVNLVLPGGFVLGQICLDLSALFPIIAAGRSADDMHYSTDFWNKRSRRQAASLPGDVFANAATICQEDLGGSLLNLNEYFPTTECSGEFLGNYAPITTLVPSLSGSQIVGNSGNVQDALAGLLPTGQAFYVNAQSTNISYPYLFEYSPDTASDNAIFHFSPSPQGSCLTYSKSNDGLLDSKGVSCDTSLPPLCYRTVETTTTIEEECEKCPGDNSVTCNKWVDLEDYPLTLEDSSTLTLIGAEICVEPCGAKTEPGTSAEIFCNDMDANAYLANLKDFSKTGAEAVILLGAQNLTSSTTAIYYYKADSSGYVQTVLIDALSSNMVSGQFHVALNKSANLNVGEDEFYWSSNSDNSDFDLAQDVSISSTSHECAALNFDGSLNFESIPCTGSLLTPMCIRRTCQECDAVRLETSTKKRQKSEKSRKKLKSNKKKLKWRQKKNRGRKIVGYNKRSIKEDRQLTGDGIPVDACIAILPPFILCTFFQCLPNLRSPAEPTPLAPTAPPVTPTPPPAPPIIPTAPPLPPTETLETLNPIRSFPQYMNTYQKTYPSQAEMTFRETVFLANLLTIEAHNQGYLSGFSTFFTRINSYGDLTFDEFAQTRTGQGQLRNDRASSNVIGSLSRGELPVNPQPPASLDYSQDTQTRRQAFYGQSGTSGCRPRVRDQGDCGSCSAQATATALEFCLCLAGEQDLGPRSVQQVSECTNGLGLDIGAQMERVNSHCVTGFPDVHYSFIMGELNGTLASEAGRPEMQEAGACDRGLDNGGTRERMVDYIYDFFTTEDYLVDSLSLIGPTTTNLLVTPLMQHYGGGVFYRPEECSDYTLEPVPEVCQVFKAGRLAYTCLKVGETKCAELLPEHCGIFFNVQALQQEDKYGHTVTALGYGEDSDGGEFWLLRNSWGEEWGEGGNIRWARGLGHCSLATQYAVPECRR